MCVFVFTFTNTLLINWYLGDLATPSRCGYGGLIMADFRDIILELKRLGCDTREIRALLCPMKEIR